MILGVIPFLLAIRQRIHPDRKFPRFAESVVNKRVKSGASAWDAARRCRSGAANPLLREMLPGEAAPLRHSGQGLLPPAGWETQTAAAREALAFDSSQRGLIERLSISFSSTGCARDARGEDVLGSNPFPQAFPRHG